MSDQRAPIPYDRYRAEAHALRSAAYGAIFRRLRRLVVGRRSGNYSGAAGAAGGQ
jgi:hypothetical protein